MYYDSSREKNGAGQPQKQKQGQKAKKKSKRERKGGGKEWGNVVYYVSVLWAELW